MDPVILTKEQSKEFHEALELVQDLEKRMKMELAFNAIGPPLYNLVKAVVTTIKAVDATAAGISVHKLDDMLNTTAFDKKKNKQRIAAGKRVRKKSTL